MNIYYFYLIKVNNYDKKNFGSLCAFILFMNRKKKGFLFSRLESHIYKVNGLCKIAGTSPNTKITKFKIYYFNDD